MSVVFQVHVGHNTPYSRKWQNEGGCPRAIAKQYLEELYNEACRYHRDLEGRKDFRNAIDAAKDAVDRASGGASAGPTRGFFNRELATSAGYVRVDIEIHRGYGHFKN